MSDVLTARNPATGAVIERINVTPPAAVVAACDAARAAQPAWAARPWHERRAVLKRFWSLLSNEADAWALAIRDEIGKPASEAYGGDVVATLDALRWTVRHGGAALAPAMQNAGTNDACSCLTVA